MCDQSALGEACPGCGGWLHRVQHGGFRFDGWPYCDPDCYEDWFEWRRSAHMDGHLATRDLLCDCAEFCAPAGRPTAAELQEYADGVAADRLANPSLYRS